MAAISRRTFFQLNQKEAGLLLHILDLKYSQKKNTIEVKSWLRGGLFVPIGGKFQEFVVETGILKVCDVTPFCWDHANEVKMCLIRKQNVVE